MIEMETGNPPPYFFPAFSHFPRPSRVTENRHRIIPNRNKKKNQETRGVSKSIFDSFKIPKLLIYLNAIILFKRIDWAFKFIKLLMRAEKRNKTKTKLMSLEVSDTPRVEGPDRPVQLRQWQEQQRQQWGWKGKQQITHFLFFDACLKKMKCFFVVLSPSNKQQAASHDSKKSKRFFMKRRKNDPTCGGVALGERHLAPPFVTMFYYNFS